MSLVGSYITTASPGLVVLFWGQVVEMYGGADFLEEVLLLGWALRYSLSPLPLWDGLERNVFACGSSGDKTQVSPLCWTLSGTIVKTKLFFLLLFSSSSPSPISSISFFFFTLLLIVTFCHSNGKLTDMWLWFSNQVRADCRVSLNSTGKLIQ